MENVQGLSQASKMKLEKDCGVLFPCKEELVFEVPTMKTGGSSDIEPAVRPQMLSWNLRDGALA